MKVYKTRARVYNSQVKGVNYMAISEARARATIKWDTAHVEKITVNLFDSRGDPTKEQIKAAAERDGMTVNAWIVETIKDKL